MTAPLGQHALLDLYGCPVALLGDVAQLETLLLRAAHIAQATVLFHHFHHFGGDGGVTGVLLLAESHISIHTWTEHQFVAADIFLCGEHANMQMACDILIKGLQATSHRLRLEMRGEIT